MGSGSSLGGALPFRTEDVPSSAAKVCVGSVMVCVAMTVVIGGSLEVAVLLLGLVRVGMDSANCSSCLSLFSSSLVEILMSMLSGWFVLLQSLLSLSLELLLSIGLHLFQLVTLWSGMSRLYSSVGSLYDVQQLLWLWNLTINQKHCVKSNSMGVHEPLQYIKYPISSPLVTYNAALRYFLGTLHSPLLLSGNPSLNTFSALDTVGMFDLMSQDNGSWLDLT